MTTDQAIKILEGAIKKPNTKDGYLGQAITMAINVLKNQPKIIRCKDCEHWDTTWQNDFTPNYHYCPLIDGMRRDDFYCADAELRGDSDGWY